MRPPEIPPIILRVLLFLAGIESKRRERVCRGRDVMRAAVLLTSSVVRDPTTTYLIVTSHEIEVNR